MFISDSEQMFHSYQVHIFPNVPCSRAFQTCLMQTTIGSKGMLSRTEVIRLNFGRLKKVRLLLHKMRSVVHDDVRDKICVKKRERSQIS